MLRSVGVVGALVLILSVAPLVAANDKEEKGAVRFRVTIPEQSLRIATATIPVDQGSLKLVKVRLTGSEKSFSPTDPGVPDLPVLDRFVALPPGAVVKDIAFQPVKSVVSSGVTLVAWTQLASAGQKPPNNKREPIEPFFGKGIEFFSNGDAIPPHPEYMKRPRWPVSLATADPPMKSIEDANVVRVRIAPFAWEPQKATLTFHPVVDVEINYTIDKTPKKSPKKAVLADVMLREELRGIVENPTAIPSLGWPRITLPDFPYVIITDNFKWSENITKGVPLDGDLIAEFQRLADWKTRRGLKATVVTISDIVAGRYGDFRTGSADLQEVIRRFLKAARGSWNTYWVLLGGSENLIPPRMVLANGWVNAAHCLGGDGNPAPPPGRYYYDAASRTVRIHAPVLTDFPDAVLYSGRDSTRFRKQPGPSAARPGWFFTTDNTYRFPALLPTEFAILRGPAADIEGTHFYIDLPENRIPTDLYYASVSDDLYDRPGLRDWDANGDGNYGQNAHERSVDGVSFYPDLAVGRAPAETVAAARAFVDRVLFYERFGWRTDRDFPHRALLSSTNWGASGPSADRERVFDTLHAGEYRARRNAVQSEADIIFAGRIDVMGPWDLVERKGDGTWRVIRFQRLASASNPGYYYTTDDTFATRSETPVDILGVTFLLPVPTRFVKIFDAPSNSFSGSKFFFDDFEADGSVLQQEEAAALIQRAAPSIAVINRRYEDWFDLTPPEPTWAFNPRDTLDLGFEYNIIGAAGHGAPSGCCGFYQFSFTGFRPSGLMYTDSCLTNSFENRFGSMSESFMNATPGGVTAYIGSTRYSWIGLGADLARVFWGRFASSPNLATLHNTKAAHVTSGSAVWANYSINLMGDPSMNLWRAPALPLTLEAPATLGTGTRLRVRVTAASEPLFATRVTLTGPGTFENALTGLDGWAEFSPLGLSAGTLTVTTAPAGYKHTEATVTMVPGR